MVTRRTTYRSYCGTRRGWWAHRKASEWACQPCCKAISKGLREENVLTLGQSIEELKAEKTGRVFWNPNLPEPTDWQP